MAMKKVTPKPAKTTAKKPAMKFESKVVPKTKKPAMKFESKVIPKTKKEEVKSLTLKRASELEKRTPEKIKGDSRTKYEREILPVTKIKKGSKLNGFQQDSVMNKAWERQAAGYQAADAKQRKMDMPQIKAEDLEERSQGRYKIPVKSKKKIKR